MVNKNIFDRELLLKNYNRYQRVFDDYNFLHLKCANFIAENIELQNRGFADVFEINPRSNFFQNYFKNSSYNSCDFAKIYDENLVDFGANKYDLIINNLDIHFINKVPEFLHKIKISLKPNGFFIASFFGDENLPELRKSMFYAENEIYKGNSLRMPPTIDIKTSARLLGQAGFKNPVADLERIVINYNSPIELLRDIKYSGQGNIMFDRSKKFFTKKLLNKLIEKYEFYHDKNLKSYPATFNIITLSGEA